MFLSCYTASLASFIGLSWLLKWHYSGSVWHTSSSVYVKNSVLFFVRKRKYTLSLAKTKYVNNWPFFLNFRWKFKNRINTFSLSFLLEHATLFPLPRSRPSKSCCLQRRTAPTKQCKQQWLVDKYFVKRIHTDISQASSKQCKQWLMDEY